jgi:hypothetical protein
MRQKSKSLHYRQTDVDRALEYLNQEVGPVKPLAYSPFLSTLCHQTRPVPSIQIFDSCSSQSITKLDESTSSPEIHCPTNIDITSYKEMSVEFVGCREDLLITTVREFLEIIVMSLLKGQTFHSELMNPDY